MKPKHLLWAVIALAVVGLALFAFRPASGGGIRNVDAAGVVKAIDGGAQVIDVRTAGEFQMGHIPGATNIPVDQFDSAAKGWDRNGKYVIYCATGARSASAVETMKALGFKDVAHFSAGIQAWTGKLEQGDSSKSQKIDTNGKPLFIEFYTNA